MTKALTTRQSELAELTEEQCRAVMLALSGATDESIAAAVGVTRQTVNGWRNAHPAFIARLNAERAAVIEAARGELRGALSRAADVVLSALDNGNGALRLKAACWLLENCGVVSGMDAPAPEEMDAGGVRAMLTERESELKRRVLMSWP